MKKTLLYLTIAAMIVSSTILLPACKYCNMKALNKSGAGPGVEAMVGVSTSKTITPTTVFSAIGVYINTYSVAPEFVTHYQLPDDIVSYLLDNHDDIKSLKIINAIYTGTVTTIPPRIFIIVPTDGQNNTIWDGSIQYKTTDEKSVPFPVWCPVGKDANIATTHSVTPAQAKGIAFPQDAHGSAERNALSSVEAYYQKAYHSGSTPKLDTTSSISITKDELTQLGITNYSVITTNNYHVCVFNAIDNNAATAILSVVSKDGAVDQGTSLTGKSQELINGLCPFNCDIY